MKTFVLISMYPRYIESCISTSIIGRAIASGFINIENLDLKDFDEKRRVDDIPFGGGPGMVIRASPVLKAIAKAKTIVGEDSIVLFMSPRGKQLEDADCCAFAEDERNIIIISGHYEGIDQRAIEISNGIEIAIGHSIVSNGCVCAIYLIDAVSRYVNGVLGNSESLKDETNSDSGSQHDLYTRPREFLGKKVPDILFSGNHKEIETWKNKFRNKPK